MSKYIERSRSYQIEQKEKRAKKLDLCIHCYGEGKIPLTYMDTGYWKEKEQGWKPCAYCRCTGRNLDLETRSYKFFQEYVNSLTFSECIYQYVQLEVIRYRQGLSGLTDDELRWYEVLRFRLRRFFGFNTDIIMLNWQRRLTKHYQFDYKESKRQKAERLSQERKKAKDRYLHKLKAYRYDKSNLKMHKRYKMVFKPTEKI